MSRKTDEEGIKVVGDTSYISISVSCRRVKQVSIHMTCSEHRVTPH
jgi:hypothetical protein